MIVSELRPGMTFVSSGGSLSELIVAVGDSVEHTFSVCIQVTILMVYNSEETCIELETYTYKHDDVLYENWIRVT